MRLGWSIGPYIDALYTVPDGFDFVEISVGEQEIAPGDIDEARLRDWMSRTGSDLVVHLPFRQPLATSVPRINEAHRTYLTELMAWAAGMDAEKVVVHARPRDRDHDPLHDVLREQVVALMDEADDLGITLCVENVGHTVGTRLEPLMELLDGADAAMCFDIGHAYLETGQDGMEAALDRHANIIEHVHVHDARDRGDSHISLGSGEIDFGRLASLLPDAVTVCAEIFTDDEDHVALNRKKMESIFD